MEFLEVAVLALTVISALNGYSIYLISKYLLEQQTHKNKVIDIDLGKEKPSNEY